jgi:hypothetical protein
MKNRDDEVLIGVDDKNDAIHALTIRGRDSGSKPIEVPPSDHERSTAVAHKRAAVRMGIDCIDDSQGNAAGLSTLARMIAQHR